MALAGLALVAFLLVRGDGDEAPSPNQLAYLGSDGALWLVNTDSDERRLLAEDGECGGFSWSPTGERLACMSQDGRIVLRGAEGTVVGELDQPAMGPVYWSPNGEAFLYWVSEPFDLDTRPEEVVYRLVLADDSGRLLADLGPWDVAGVRPGQAYRGFPLWSPDGGRLAYRTADTGEARIYSLGTGTEQVLEGDYHPLGWALEGEALLVAANYQPPPEPMAFPSYEVNLLDLSSGELRRLPELDSRFQFWISPDGSYVAALTRGRGLPGLAVLDIGSGRYTPIPDSVITYGSDHIPKKFVTFSPDGTYLYWVGGDNAGYRASSDGTGLAKLFELDELVFAWSPDLTMIAYNDFDDDVDSMTLYVAEVGGSNVRQVDYRSFAGQGSASPFRFGWRPRP